MTAKKDTHAQLPEGDETRIQEVLARRQAIAEELHNCTTRAQAEALLKDVFSADEATQMVLLKRLVRARDADAADLLLAMHELAPEKVVRKEARRALIQLAGAKVYPSWTPEAEPAAGGAVVEHAPRFWKGVVAEIRESGELQLTLCWEQGVDYGEARMLSFLLDFWEEGVKDFFTETGTKRHINEHIQEMQQASRAAEARMGDERGSPTVYVDCTLAEGRRLLNEALEVNRWRKTEPHKDFRHYFSLVQQLVLHAQEVGEDRGSTFISRGLEPDMVAANFAGAWSMGDYGLCYDLLTRGSALTEGHARDGWVELRRKWADEAHPARFEVYFLREREQNRQSALWVPASVLSARAGGPKEIELGWSLELTETQLSGTLPEMPMGTAVYKETGRHWFWTIFSLEQEDGEWRIARLKDEGAAIQGLPLDELQRRVKEHNDAMQKIMNEHNPNDPDAEQYFDEIIWRTWQSLALDDAILARNPLDKAVYEDAYGRAMSIRAVERAVVYAEQLVKRFPNDPDAVTARQRLGAVQIAVAERFESLRQNERAEHFMSLGETTLRDALTENDPLGHLLLAELLIGKEAYDSAEELLLKARELAQERELRAQVEFDLASLAIERKRFTEARGYLERLAEIAPNYPELWATLGFVHRSLENYPEAELYYKRAIEEEPADVRAYSDLSAIYASQQEFDKARDILSQGIRALPSSAHLRALMAMVYLEKEDRVRAQEYLEEAERLNPNLEIVQAVRELLDQSRKRVGKGR
jgi:tetratricopeptide (TPR) repeat protein